MPNTAAEGSDANPGAPAHPVTPAIGWDPPVARAGPLGSWDRFVGPGQTRLELMLTLVPSAAGAVAAALALALDRYSVAEVALAAALAFDLVGGVVANAASAGQRWYHRPAASAAGRFGFVALHLAYIVVFGLVFLDGDWAFVGVVYGVLLAAAAVTLLVPFYVQRPVARIGFVVGTAVGLGFFSIPVELQWFVPVLYCKLLISHLTREAPFAPPAGE